MRSNSVQPRSAGRFFPLKPSKTGQLIVVVSRNEDSRTMLRAVLELWGYEVREANGVDESINANPNEKPSLVLLESTLQFNESLNEIKKLRQNENLRLTPSVVLSGFSQPDYCEAALKVGASAVLVKPVDFDLLEGYVERLVREAR